LQLLNTKMQDELFYAYANSFRRTNRFFNYWIHATITDVFNSDFMRNIYY
jgi:hypothetical protein